MRAHLLAALPWNPSYKEGKNRIKKRRVGWLA
jgi:hypothetical protein